MDQRNLEKAMDLYGRLITGEEVSKKVNKDLYDSYVSNPEVFDILDTVLKKSNLKLYEYNDSLFVCAAPGNKVFGFTNDELKKEIGLRLNKELYLAYYIIFETILLFYENTQDVVSREYVKATDVVEAVNTGLSVVLKKMGTQALTEVEENSFKLIATLWDELPVTAQNEDMSSLKAARGSKIGLTKLVFNFLKSQEMFFDNGDRYYATDRFRAIVKNYYEEASGRLLDIARGGEWDAAY